MNTQKKVSNFEQNKSAWLRETGLEQAKKIVLFLKDQAPHSVFCADLIRALQKYGSLTPNQQAAVLRMMAPKPETAAMPKILEAMNTAKNSGLKKPAMRFEDGILITSAPDYGRNKGAVYVKHNRSYSGKITPSGDYEPTSNAKPELLKGLQGIEQNPKAAATRYGRATSTCCCCGRELSDPVSVEMGIGPICAKRFGFL